MAEDDNGIDAISQDGAGASVSELAKRSKGGGSAASRGEKAAGEEPLDEADDGQLFVWEQGQKVTLSNIIDRKVPVEHAFVFTGKRIKGRGGLMALDEQPVMVVRGMAGPVRVVPTHDGDGKVTKVVIEQSVAAVVVHPAASEEAVAMASPLFEQFRLDQSKTA